jgi:hypothetical protein
MKSAPPKDASAARLELLESILEERGIGREAKPAGIPKRPEGQTVPLSFAQHRLWFLEQLIPGTATYNVHSAIHLRGGLDAAGLEHSLNVVVQRHESLRTSFQVVADQPVQIIAEKMALHLEITDLQEAAEFEREGAARRLAAEEARTPFDLSQGPLLRVKLLRLGAEEHVFLLTLHHIVSDELSLGILMEEIGSIYTSRQLNKRPALPPLVIQYGDYAAWQREWLQGEMLENQMAYWRQQLQDAPAMLELPADHPRSSAQIYRGAYHQFLFEDDLSDGVSRLAWEENATLFMVLLAALQVLLSRYAGQQDIVVGTPIANRTRRETEPLIGLFVNTLALRSRIRAHESFRNLLDRVRQDSLRAFEHLELPFEKLVEELQPERDQNRTPIFQVMFVMQSGRGQAVRLPGLKLTPLPARTNAAKFDLTWWVQEVDTVSLVGNLEYNADLFEQETIARMAAHYKHLIRSVITTPDRDLGHLPLMSPAERRQILEEWNQTAVSFPKDLLIHELFEKQAEATPQAVALTMGDYSLTYAELNRQVNQLARYLREKGVGPDRLVGICIERSPRMILAVLGVLKAGGAYVPLDTGDPLERLRYMIEDSRIGLLFLSNPQALSNVLVEWQISLM